MRGAYLNPRAPLPDPHRASPQPPLFRVRRRVPERTPETPLKMHDGVFKASPSSSIDLDAAVMASAKKPYSSPIYLSDGSKTNKRERRGSAETLASSATSVMDVPLDVPLPVRLSS